MENEEKKPASMSNLSKVASKVAQVTWFKTHEALMNPGLNHLTSYQLGNPNMNGDKKFHWVVGSDYVYSQVPGGEMAIIPLVQFGSLTVKL